MTTLAFTMNGTDGATATVAASPGGGNTGGYAISTGSGSTQTLRAAAAREGSTGLRTVSDGTAVSAVRFTLGGSSGACATSLWFKIPSNLPTTASHTFEQFNDSTVSRILQLQYTTIGTVRAFDKANTVFNLLTASQAVAGTWFRIEVVVSAISTTAGAFTARIFNTSGTLVGTALNVTNANLGTSNISSISIGHVTTGAAVTQDLDTLQIAPGQTTEIGPYSANSTPPTVNAGSNISTTPGTLVNLAGTATAAGSSSSSTLTLQWSLISAIDNTGTAISGVTITNSTSANASFTPAAGKFGRYIFQLQATDVEGNSATDQVRVFTPGTQIGVIEVTSNTGWATTSISNVNDSSDLTFAESGAVGSNSVLVYRLGPLQAATTAFSLVVHSLIQAAGGTQKVALLEGSTVRKDWGAISPNVSGSGAMTDVTLTLTSGERTAIGSWLELDVQLTQV